MTPVYYLFNKPYQVLTQFTDSHNRMTLSNYINTPGIYSAGRLDYDSEGLLLLTNHGRLIHNLSHPDAKIEKTYLVQVEGKITSSALQQLQSGVHLKEGKTRPAKAIKVDQPEWLWHRSPPIRQRAHIPTSWIELSISEGKNRQVRRMTAATGFPTLRLVRIRIGNLQVQHLRPGESQAISYAFLAQQIPLTGLKTRKTSKHKQVVRQHK